VKLRTCLTALGLCALLLGGRQAVLGDDKTKKDATTFTVLEGVARDAAQSQALTWLKQAGNADMKERFEAIWKNADRSTLDCLADTFGLANGDAAKLMSEARDPLAPAPTAVPALFSDKKHSDFFRANLSLAYARALSNRRVHEEALEVLKTTDPTKVADPAAYLFHRAVCEHALLKKDQAERSIDRLLQDALDAPERYKTVAALIMLDMRTWKSKDLAEVARKMDNVERRLELARGGPVTQAMQKDIVLRLDELIKKLENKAKKPGNGNGGGCPDGSCPNPGNTPGSNPSNPLPDSQVGGATGPGQIDQAKLRQLAQGWGQLPEVERTRVIQQLTRGMSSKHREAIINYFKNVANSQK
jgi:hypothetical protein